MTFDEFRAYVEARMASEWSTTPISFENVTDSAALKAAKDSKSPWVRFVIREGDGALDTIGSDSRLERHAGIVFVSIFVAQGDGTETARSYAKDIAAIFRGYFAEPCVHFRTPYVNVVGAADGWFQLNLLIPFENNEYYS